MASPRPKGGQLTEDGKAFVEACAGALGSLAATWIIFPLDTARARFQARNLGEFLRLERAVGPCVVST